MRTSSPGRRVWSIPCLLPEKQALPLVRTGFSYDVPEKFGLPIKPWKWIFSADYVFLSQEKHQQRKDEAM